MASVREALIAATRRLIILYFRLKTKYPCPQCGGPAINQGLSNGATIRACLECGAHHDPNTGRVFHPKNNPFPTSDE